MNKKISNIFKGDKVVWIVFFFLCMISLVEVFSASSHLSYDNNYVMPMLRHAVMLAIGTFVAVVVLNIPCRYFKLLTVTLLVVSVITLLWVLVAGQNINGAQRMIPLFGITFQPSEIAKGAVVLAVAQILGVMQHENGADKMAFRYILTITIPITFLILLENLSTAVLLAFVVVLMMFVGRVPMVQLGKLFGVVLVIAALGLAFIFMAGSAVKTADETGGNEVVEQVENTTEKKKEGALEKLFHRASTWKNRIEKFSDDKEVAPKDYDLDKDAQVAHANIAIVSSNFIGKGPGNSVERDFLAQAFSDFIYAIIIEEMGIFGAAFVVFLYVILLFRAARIASQCENNFPAFLVMGLALLLVVQATFNMMVAVGIVPVTGQPLPLISRGGTSTIINCAYIGAILSVSRSAKQRKKELEKQNQTVDIAK
ncbi:MAG: FtsW/RodA/SpoVE family cell cycle protein [Prevotella sp.]